MDDQQKPDLTMVATGELWNEMSSRYANCVFLGERPGKQPTDLPVDELLISGSHNAAKGLMNKGDIIWDAMARAKLLTAQRKPPGEQG